jgi:hypothetical protein
MPSRCHIRWQTVIEPSHGPKYLNAGVSFLEFRALQLGQVPHLIYSSERFHARAHPIQRCPSQTQANRTGPDNPIRER